jgi:hypothetical protein
MHIYSFCATTCAFVCMFAVYYKSAQNNAIMAPGHVFTFMHIHTHIHHTCMHTYKHTCTTTVHYKNAQNNGIMAPGHVFTIEPMINEGAHNVSFVRITCVCAIHRHVEHVCVCVCPCVLYIHTPIICFYNRVYDERRRA